MAASVKPSELSDWIGKETGVSNWFEITQERINDFADATVDHQFIHLDEEKAAKTPFGGTIAHGFLTLSLLTPLSKETGLNIEGAVMYINYGIDKLRFLTPVRAGKRVRLRSVMKDVVEKGPGRLLITKTQTVEIEGEDKPALISDSLAMVVVE